MGPDAFSLDGMVVLVTGSTRGIGRAIALDAAESGATVLVTGRSIDDADVVADEIGSDGGYAEPFRYNAAEPDAQEQLIAEIADKVGKLDVLINNAGVLRPHVLDRLSEAEFDEVFTVNTKAAVFLAKSAAPMLRQSDAAAIVNITAAGGHRPMAGLGAYCASKAAMLNFTVTMAAEWAPFIRVNAVTPGSVPTDMIMPSDAEERADFEIEMAEQNLLKRLAEPSEIAHAVRFLASPAASYITGQSLIVDGGYLA